MVGSGPRAAEEDFASGRFGSSSRWLTSWIWPVLACSFRLPWALSERLPCGEDKARPAGPNNSTFPVRDSTVRDFPTLDLSLPAWSTSPRDAEGAVSLPLPRDTPSLEMFSSSVDMLSLIENKGVLSSVFGFTLSVDLPDPKMTCLSPCKLRCFVPDVTRSVTRSPTTCVDPSTLRPPGTKVRGPPPLRSRRTVKRSQRVRPMLIETRRERSKRKAHRPTRGVATLPRTSTSSLLTKFCISPLSGILDFHFRPPFTRLMLVVVVW